MPQTASCATAPAAPERPAASAAAAGAVASEAAAPQEEAVGPCSGGRALELQAARGVLQAADLQAPSVGASEEERSPASLILESLGDEDAEAAARLGEELMVECSDPAADAPEENTISEYRDLASLTHKIRSGAVRLVRAEFVVDQFRNSSEPLACRQDLPEEAFLDVPGMTEEELALLSIFAVSYCWLSKDHPDPCRFHLRTLALVLEKYCASEPSGPEHKPLEEIAALRAQGYDFGGRGRPVGVFIDWTSLFQDKPKGRRSDRENELFLDSLEGINTWYAHDFTTVLALTSLPPGVDRTPYFESGWTVFERTVAGLTTPGARMLLLNDEARLDLVAGKWKWKPFLDLVESYKDKSRGAPLAPEAFNRLIEGKRVTNNADVQGVLIPKYLHTFQGVIGTAGSLRLRGCGLNGRAARETLHVVRDHCPGLREFRLPDNRGVDLKIPEVAAVCGRLEILDLQNTKAAGDIAGLSVLTQLRVLTLRKTSVSGEVAGLAALAQLQTLSLANTRVVGSVSGLEALAQLREVDLSWTIVDGDVAGLAALPQLRELCLALTQVQGDVARLAALTQLQRLDLSKTRVHGDAAALAALPRLRELCLGQTCAEGDVAGLAALMQLQRLGLAKTRVHGDVAGLAALTQLQTLDLADTEVHGDAAGLAALTQLQRLDLARTHVHGDVAGLAALAQLQTLDLSRAEVHGDVAGLAGLSQLQRLDLTSTHVAGSAASLAVLTHLRKLAIGDTRVTGDVGGLTGLSQLQRLDLSSTRVTGNVADLAALTQLQKLAIGDSRVDGDVAGLAKLSQLQTLDLSSTQVTGNVADLAVLTQLRKLAM